MQKPKLPERRRERDHREAGLLGIVNLLFHSPVAGVWRQESFHLHDGKFQDMEFSVPLLRDGRPSQHTLLSWQKQEEPETWLFNFVISSCFGRLWWVWVWFFKCMITIFLGRSERESFPGAGEGQIWCRCPFLPRRGSPKGLRGPSKWEFPKCMVRKLLDKVLFRELDYRMPLIWYVGDWMGGEFGKEGMHVYVWVSLYCSPETITTLLIDYTPVQSRKLKKNAIDWVTGFSLPGVYEKFIFAF